MLWRPVGMIGPRRPTVDVSLGGMRMYCDELLKVGVRLELDLLLQDEDSIEFLARVVRVEVLPAGSPAAFDVALEFLDVTPEAQRWLDGRLTTKGRLPEPASREEDRPRETLPSRPPAAAAPSSRRPSLHARRPLQVLFVTPYLPSPPRFGGQMRLHGLISGVAARHEVSVLSLVDVNEDQVESVRETEAYCRRVLTVPNRRYAAGGASKRLLQLGSLFSSHSYEWLVHHEASFEAALDQAIEAERYDVVNFEFTHMAAYRAGHRGRGRLDPAFVLDEHNIEYDLLRQTARAGSDAVRRVYNAVDWRKVRSEELRTWAGLDGCTLTSERDQAMLLADAPHTRTAVVPNGVDVEFFKPPQPPPPRSPETLLFFGAIDYFPNTDGLRFFLGEVWPKLRSRVPRVKLSIVGRRPPAEIVAHRGPDVQITGAVEDVRPHLARAAVVIVPLRLGGGTRLKILEAMAMGKAVVSTTVGAEGLGVVPERDLLIADDAEGFAAQIRRLLDDPGLAASLGASARALVVERYGWQASVDRLCDFYGEVLEARAAAPGASAAAQ